MRLVQGDGPSRKAVTIAVDGRRMAVSTRRGDGPDDRKEKAFDSPSEARAAADRLARELLGRGYAEDVAGDGDDPGGLYDLAEPIAPAPIPRLAPPPPPAPTSPRKRRTRKKGAAEQGEDPKTLLGLAATAMAGVGLIALLVWLVMREPSFEGTWRSSRGFDFSETALIGPTQVVTFRRDGSVTLIREDEHLFLDGSYEVGGGRLRCRFDRGNSWELGDFDLADEPVELDTAYEFRGGWLYLLDEEGGSTALVRLPKGGGSRVARGGPDGSGTEAETAEDQPPAPTDPLLGRWTLSAFERGGAPADGGPSWVAFDGATATFGPPATEPTAPPTAARYTVDLDRRPKWIDLRDDRGPRLGFFAVTGDVLTVVLNDRPGGPRPSAFAQGGEDARVRLVLTRGPSDDDGR